MIYVVSLLFAIAATVLAFVFIVPEKKAAKLNKFGKFLHDTLNFKYLIVEKILQALYIFATAMVILSGFFMIFDFENEMSLSGLLMMIVGPIAVRLGFEFSMMFILLIKNVIQINNRLAGNKANDVFAAPEVPFAAPEAPAAPAAPTAAYCTNCGAAVEAGSFCTNCGTKN